MHRRTKEQIDATWDRLAHGNWTHHEDPFNAKPRPIVLLEVGPLSVELGQAQRKCRSCTRAIPKGEYHLAVGYGEGSSSIKVCEGCIMATAQWCKISNRRNL